MPENPAAPNGRSIALKIAWLESEAGGGSTPDPVFFIAGGPGQSATEVAAIVDMGLHEVRKQRDIFLVDQRGTGGSHPLECRDAAGKPLALDNSSEATAEQLTAYAARCAEGLRNDADPRYYTTSEAIGDLDAVRAALGVQTLNLIGASYGTRVAQHYAARYPQHTRTVVIDGVAPNDLVIGGEFARTFEDAIALQSAQCRQQPACAKRFPVDTATQLRQVVERLRQAPVAVEYRDPRTGALRHEQVTADTVAGLAFGFSYAPETASLLPLVLDEAAAGRYPSLMALAQISASGMSDQMNRLMQWSVLCSEDAGRYHPPAHQDTTLLGNEVAEMFFAPCKVWPSAGAGCRERPVPLHVAGVAALRRARPGHTATLCRARAAGTAQRPACDCARAGAWRVPAGLHAQGAEPVHADRRCQGAGYHLRCQPQHRACLHLVQRMGTMSRIDHATEALA